MIGNKEQKMIRQAAELICEELLNMDTKETK
jgi:hypothetical protein